jgi:hypothetical protein
MIKYVVKADLASFYDYVDHEILGRELLIRTGDHAAVECLGQTFDPVVRAEASFVLAGANLIEPGEITRALDREPSALASWYLVALRRLHEHDAGLRDTYQAIRGEGGLNATILAGP